MGTNLFVAVVTASAAGTSDSLVPGELYAYDLEATTAVGSFSSLTVSGFYSRPGVTLSDTQLAFAGMSGVHASVAKLPTFVLPASTPDGLRIVHGSCRKPHADALDALTLMDKMLRETASSATDRPQQLLMTGDQIYGDDVGDPIMALIREVAPLVMGSEILPGVGPDELKVGGRGHMVVAKFGYSFGKSHLLTYGEFATMYLMVWSDVLWPQLASDIPTFEQVFPGEETHVRIIEEEHETPKFAGFQKEREAIQHVHKGLADVRRALANVATYMIFDDHEVTDDFYLNREWLETTVLDATKPLSRRGVMDGLLAFMVFQAVGNKPGEYNDLMDRLREWVVAGFPASGTLIEELDAQIGLPTLGVAIEIDGEFARANDPVWNFEIAWDCHEIIALDTRTHRIYPAGGLSPPGMVSNDSLPIQISGVAPNWTDASVGGVSLVVLPAPAVGLSFIEGLQTDALGSKEKTRARDVEAPRLDPVSFDRLIFRLAARDGRRSRVVLLSGDVHYGYVGALEYWSPKAMDTLPNPPAQETRATFAQVVSSALKNQHPVTVLTGTLALHFGGFRLSRKQITRFGWKTNQLSQSSLTVGEVEWEDTLVDPPELKKSDWQILVDRDGFASTDLTREISRFASVTPGTPTPDWRNRLTLIPGGPKSVTVTRVDDEPVNDAQKLIGFITILFNWLTQYVRIARGGREIVGVNNIATLGFRWNAGEDKAVIQELHWWAKDYRSLYAAHDNNTDAQFLTTTRAEAPLAILEPPANVKIVF